MSTVVIELKQARVFHLPKGGRLLPGQNNIDAQAWAKDKKNKTVKQWLELELLVDKGEGEAVPLADDIGRVQPGKARLWIEHTDDLALLLKWRHNETRDAVRQYIDARIETVKNAQTVITEPEDQQA